MRLLLAALVLAALSLHSAQVTLVDVFEQELAQEHNTCLGLGNCQPSIWRFARYQQPMAATLRIYADGRRLVQGRDYKLAKDAIGWHIETPPALAYDVIVADFKE